MISSNLDLFAITLLWSIAAVLVCVLFVMAGTKLLDRHRSRQINRRFRENQRLRRGTYGLPRQEGTQ